MVNETLQFRDSLCKKQSDSLGILPWIKADFDHNGRTDILVIGTLNDYHMVLCILEVAGRYQVHYLTNNDYHECTFPIVENNKIKYYFNGSLERKNRFQVTPLQDKVLLYKFGGFIEENAAPASHKITEITYETKGCFGECPAFILTLNANRSAKWIARSFNKIGNREVGGTFRTTLTESKYTTLLQLLNYIDFEKLEDKYAVSWSDDQAATLTIKYDNGQVKTIDDFGLRGTFGLIRAYEMLSALLETQKWIRNKGA